MRNRVSRQRVQQSVKVVGYLDSPSRGEHGREVLEYRQAFLPLNDHSMHNIPTVIVTLSIIQSSQELIIIISKKTYNFLQNETALQLSNTNWLHVIMLPHRCSIPSGLHEAHLPKALVATLVLVKNAEVAKF